MYSEPPAPATPDAAHDYACSGLPSSTSAGRTPTRHSHRRQRCRVPADSTTCESLDVLSAGDFASLGEYASLFHPVTCVLNGHNDDTLLAITDDASSRSSSSHAAHETRSETNEVCAQRDFCDFSIPTLGDFRRPRRPDSHCICRRLSPPLLLLAHRHSLLRRHRSSWRHLRWSKSTCRYP